FHTRYDNTPSGKRGDEIGYLYSTRAFLAPGSAGDGIPAEHVADEMIACRNREPSPHLPGLHYAAVWYGGPFRSWRQFNAFCDGLVSGGLLDDTRPIFFDFDVTNAISWRLGGGGSDDLVASDIQRKLAAQAMADVLKANFNPNCTLNELNPDANLCTLIDKTDLIVNSTEFCFTSMGTVEIESEGLILRTPGGQDFLAVRSASTVARKKIHCLVQIYDTYRETTQADFALGESQTVTGDKTVELGPEPAGSASATQCRWSGWIQLATAGGPGLACDRSSAMHAHFASDHRLHHHADGLLDPIGATPRCRNNPDRTEPLPGPYGPALGPRDWQISHPPANPQVRAPGDLRIDGAYVERDSSLMFANSLSVYDSTGTVAMWVKPSFRPEMAGKPRTFFSVDTLKSDSVNSGSGRGMPASGSSWQIVNGLWFFASADAPAFTPSPNEGQFPFYSPGPWRPASIVCGYSTWSANGGGVGMASDTLNHRAHVHAPKPDLLRHHGWTHLTYLWDMPRYELALWINGQPQPNSEMIQVHPRLISAVDYQEPGNTIRLGEPSLTMQLDTSEPLLGRPVSRNWAADATIDEFYLWKGNQLDRGQELFAQGRYHRPTPAAEAVFTSQGIRFSGSMRDLPPPSTVAPPVSVIAAPPSGGASRPSTRVLAAAWTWYPESLSWTGQPQVHDYRDDTDVQARVEMNLLLNGVTLPFVLSDDAGALVPNLTMTPEDSLRYRLSMRLPNANPDVILLATPVIDDVTLHFSTGIHFLFYELVGMSI
ncbi:MAG: hypothetical protein HYY16_03820, partial [Planctomycetes bacterium]|nr:hypothetical protein [Planctomycetota bacterium]